MTALANTVETNKCYANSKKQYSLLVLSLNILSSLHGKYGLNVFKNERSFTKQEGIYNALFVLNDRNGRTLKVRQSCDPLIKRYLELGRVPPPFRLKKQII